MLLGAMQALLGDEGESVRQLQTAVALRPNEAGILYNAGCTYAIMKRKSETLEMFKRAVSNDTATWTGCARIRTSTVCMTIRNSKNW